jgi:hypothetical protein
VRDTSPYGIPRRAGYRAVCGVQTAWTTLQEMEKSLATAGAPIQQYRCRCTPAVIGLCYAAAALRRAACQNRRALPRPPYVPELGSPVRQLHRDRARPCARLHQDRAHPSHICARTGRTPSHICARTAWPDVLRVQAREGRARVLQVSAAEAAGRERPSADATCNMQHAAHHKQRAVICSMQRAACSAQRTTLPHTSTTPSFIPPSA